MHVHPSLGVSLPLQIRSVVWNADDSRLVSCGTDGAVYEWSLSSGKRETECVLKSCSYNCVTISPDAKIIFAVGSDHTLKEIADSSVSLPPPAPGLPSDRRGQSCIRSGKESGVGGRPERAGSLLHRGTPAPHSSSVTSVIVTSGISCPGPCLTGLNCGAPFTFVLLAV